MKKESKKIILIGAGNVATQLAIALTEAGHTIVQVFSKTQKHAKQLAEKLNAGYTNKIKEISGEGDVYIIAVKDDAIADVVSKIHFKNQLVVHTSGSVDMNVLKKSSQNYGVFYPLQTFSKEKKADFKNIPLCIEANTKQNEKTLIALAKYISKNVHIIDSEKRKILHLAAVFSCNFTNHLYAIADTILKKEKLSLSILFPLIQETANKIKNRNPKEVQTGPAIREDNEVMKKHLALLSQEKDFQDIYKLISKSIIETKGEGRGEKDE